MFLIDIIGINIYTHQHDRFEVGFTTSCTIGYEFEPRSWRDFSQYNIM
jgi:hypothetical protein